MRIPKVILPVGLVGIAGLLAACGSNGADAPTSTASSSHMASGGTMSMSAASADDVSFAQLMIPHHQQAVTMADLALEQASSKQIRTLAKQIRAAQEPEIALMTQWLQNWSAPAPMESDHGSHDLGSMTGEGMMTDPDMAQLAAAAGAEFDRMWLRMMIEHHTGAIAMAKNVLASTANPDVKGLAQAIVDGQSTEISTMRGLPAK